MGVPLKMTEILRQENEKEVCNYNGVVSERTSVDQRCNREQGINIKKH